MTIIGYVEEGLEVLEKINATLCDNKKRPFNPIRIRHAVVLDEDEGSHPRWFPRELPESPLEIVDAKLEAEEETDERVLREREKEAIARAQEVELELMGDLPSADIKPPSNVLFVCQLNPVTEDEDLKTVFARFGEIEKCEIIRDYKTGDSLQYAFVEFKHEESCNKAYVAMQNVLVDDRRIKVDFSQSVSKMWNQYRRQGKHAHGTVGNREGRRSRSYDKHGRRESHNHSDQRPRDDDRHRPYRDRSRDRDRRSYRPRERSYSRDRYRDHR
jgi:peptidyl-prolyl cis-trans isomerase-like 4